MKYERLLHRVNSTNTYDEVFFAYNSQGNIGGLCGLHNINTHDQDAEFWGMSFRGNTETHEALHCIEDYSANTLNLQSIYALVDNNNKACKHFWKKHKYDNKEYENISGTILRYTKKLHKQNTH